MEISGPPQNGGLEFSRVDRLEILEQGGGSGLEQMCPDGRVYNLEVEGSPPEFFEGVRARLLKEQDDNGGTEAKVDYVFDIPVELASMFCGYRHDRWKFDWGQPSFTCLRETIQK